MVLICSYEFSQLFFGRRRKSFALSLKDIFAGYRKIGLEPFSFLSESNIPCLLACLVSDDKSRVVFVFVSLCVCVPPQYLPPQIYFSLLLVFSSLIVLCCAVLLQVSSAWILLNFLNLWIYHFSSSCFPLPSGIYMLLLLLLSRFSRVWLCATP